MGDSVRYLKDKNLTRIFDGKTYVFDSWHLYNSDDLKKRKQELHMKNKNYRTQATHHNYHNSTVIKLYVKK